MSEMAKPIIISLLSTAFIDQAMQVGFSLHVAKAEVAICRRGVGLKARALCMLKDLSYRTAIL